MNRPNYSRSCIFGHPVEYVQGRQWTMVGTKITLRTVEGIGHGAEYNICLSKLREKSINEGQNTKKVSFVSVSNHIST